MLRTIPLTALLGLAVVSVLAGAASVSAHADYERSEPGRNEILPEQPDRVDVFFTQEVLKQEGLNHVQVFDEQGNQVSEGNGEVVDEDRKHMFAELQPGLPPGRFVVDWKTRSFEDGEDDSGKFCFYVGVQPTAEQAAECRGFDEEEGITSGPTVGGPDVTDTPAPTATDAPAPATEAAPSPTPEVEADDDDDGGFSTGAIIGIIVGVVVLIAAVGGGAIWLRSRQG